MKRIICAIAVLALATASSAQNVPLQGGPWTAGHSPMYSVSGGSQPVIQDSGPAGGGAIGAGLLELLQVSQAANGVTTAPYANSGSGPLSTHACFYDAPITNQTGYHYLCLDANAQGGGLVAYGAGGGAAAVPLKFNINGTVWNPLSTPGGISATAPLAYSSATGIISLNIGAGLTTSVNSLVLAGPQVATFGGALSFTCAAHQWANAMAATTGAWTCAQPAFTDISGSAACGQLPALTGDATTSAGSCATTISASAVTNAKMANVAAYTFKGNNTSAAAAPSDITVPQTKALLGLVKSVTDPAFLASGSSQTTTGTISSGLTALTLTAAIDFVNGQGIRVAHAGGAFSASPPTSPSVSNIGAAGAVTYAYKLSCLDGFGGVGTAIASFQTTTGNATLNATNYNSLSWTGGAGCYAYAIYGRSGGNFNFIGTTTQASFADQGQSPPVSPDWIPATASGSSLPQSLITTISAGAGTTSLTLAAGATNTATTQGVSHDDAAAIQACLNSLASGGTCFVPRGNYNIGSTINFPSAAAAWLIGEGRGNAASLPDVSGTHLVAAHALSPMILLNALAVRGSRISSMVIDGNTLPFSCLSVPAISESWFDNLSVYDCSGENIVVGNGSAGAVDNHFDNIQIDNPRTLQVPNLAFYNFEVKDFNTIVTRVVAANASTANFHEATTAQGSLYNLVHAYDFLNGTAQAPVYNFLVEGAYANIETFQADGGSTVADVQINGNNNNILSGQIQFAAAGSPTIGVQFANNTSGNMVTGSLFKNFTTANSIVQAGAAANPGNFYIGNYNSTQGTVIGSSLTNTIAPTLTAGCNGAGQVISGNKYYGTITGQTTASTSCTLTFGGNGFSSTPNCNVSGQTAAITSFTPSTTTLVVNFASVANFKWVYQCSGS
jgi:hypothetical protein